MLLLLCRFILQAAGKEHKCECLSSLIKYSGILEKCSLENSVYTKYLYSKCNTCPYITLKYIPLQVTAFHKIEVRAFGEIVSLGSVACERCHRGDDGHGSLVIQIWFHHGLQVTACLPAHLCVYQLLSKN